MATRFHAAFLGAGLILSFLLSCVRGVFDRGSLLPPFQEFIASAMFGLLVTLAGWLGYAAVVSGFVPLLGPPGRGSMASSITSALVLVILVYSGLLPRALQILRKDLGLHIPRMLFALAVLPILTATSTALILRVSRRSISSEATPRPPQKK
jgi:hypothetical protein